MKPRVDVDVDVSSIVFVVYSQRNESDVNEENTVNWQRSAAVNTKTSIADTSSIRQLH